MYRGLFPPCIRVAPSSLSDGSHLQTMMCLFSERGGPMKTLEGLEMLSLPSKQTEGLCACGFV